MWRTQADANGAAFGDFRELVLVGPNAASLLDRVQACTDPTIRKWVRYRSHLKHPPPIRHGRCGSRRINSLLIANAHHIVAQQ